MEKKWSAPSNSLRHDILRIRRICRECVGIINAAIGTGPEVCIVRVANYGVVGCVVSDVGFAGKVLRSRVRIEEGVWKGKGGCYILSRDRTNECYSHSQEGRDCSHVRNHNPFLDWGLG